MKAQNLVLQGSRSPLYPHLPPAFPAMRIGLFGGSFDPPHRGHVHLSLHALKKLRLDQVWWLVTPGNPLKTDGPWPLRKRLQQIRHITSHPRIIATGLEARIGTTYTADTLKFLVRKYPATRFVWLMGADNLVEFHRWRRWRDIFRTIPIAILDRPGYRYRALAAPAAKRFETCRRPESTAPELARLPCPAWIFLSLPLNPLSSTKIREKAGSHH